MSNTETNTPNSNTGIPNVYHFEGSFKGVIRKLIQTIASPFLSWGRRWSIYPLFLGMKCCAIEMGAAMTSRYDTERLGIMPRASPRHCDLIILNGPVSVKFAPRLRDLYDQMPAPKFVIAMGECAISGGPFWQADSILDGADEVIPVDVYIPGCPPRPEALLHGIAVLQQKIKRERGQWLPETMRGYPVEFYPRDPPIIDFRLKKTKIVSEEEYKQLGGKAKAHT